MRALCALALTVSSALTLNSQPPRISAGVWEPGFPSSASLPAAEQFAVRPSVVIYYGGWGQPFESGFATAARADGAEVLAEIQTCESPCETTGIPGGLATVVSGASDAYLKSFAQEVRAFGHPVLLTFDHEMNGSWYPWGYGHETPARYVAAWRHVYDVIHPVAPNATWLWAPNRPDPGVPTFGPWFPGSRYVNETGVDSYYWRATDRYAQIIHPSVVALRALAPGKPVIIAETGIVASCKFPQVRDLVAGMRADHLWLVLYFDTTPFTLRGHPYAAAVLRRLLA